MPRLDDPALAKGNAVVPAPALAAPVGQPAGVPPPAGYQDGKVNPFPRGAESCLPKVSIRTTLNRVFWTETAAVLGGSVHRREYLGANGGSGDGSGSPTLSAAATHSGRGNKLVCRRSQYGGTPQYGAPSALQPCPAGAACQQLLVGDCPFHHTAEEVTAAATLLAAQRSTAPQQVGTAPQQQVRPHI